MAVTPNIVTLPPPSVPFLDQTGYVSKAWYYFLLALLNRTGGSTTPVNLATLQEQVVSLFVEEAMNDDPSPVPSVGLSLADVMGGDDPGGSIAPALLAAWAGDAEPRAPINPFLASLLVADAA